jgi:hypothetical protein
VNTTMGYSTYTPSRGLSIPHLADLMGYSHTRIYQLTKAGKGPALTPIKRSPLSDHRARPECFVAWDDAIRWLEQRPDAHRFTDALRTLRVQRVMAHVRTGTPLPPPVPPPAIPAARLEPSTQGGRAYWNQRRARMEAAGRAAHMRAAQGTYTPITDGLLT